MTSRISVGIAAVSLALLALTGCAGSDPAAPDDDAPAVPVGLATADSSLGEIVVDSEGMTVYQFDQDTQGGDTSSCTGSCSSNWPAVPGGDDAPELEGITGEVGTITGADGELQLTLNGWPLYYFAGDESPGDVNGQGVNDVWWALTPAGEPVTDAAGTDEGTGY